jgi:hypothetical protein
VHTPSEQNSSAAQQLSPHTLAGSQQPSAVQVWPSAQHTPLQTAVSQPSSDSGTSHESVKPSPTGFPLPHPAASKAAAMNENSHAGIPFVFMSNPSRKLL